MKEQTLFQTVAAFQYIAALAMFVLGYEAVSIIIAAMGAFSMTIAKDLEEQ